MPWQSTMPRRRPPAFAWPVSALASLLLASLTAFADAPPVTLDSILASLAQRRHGHALYTEQVDSALFKHPLHSSGELFFDAPDRLEKKTLQPSTEDLIVEGDVVTVVRGTHRSSMRLRDYPQLSPLLNGIRATLAGDRSTLESNFQLALEANGSGWVLTLRPLASEIKPVYKRIEIFGVDGVVQGIKLERMTGELTSMTLSESAEP
jgi:outer membrane lipoprotein-sorting protein